MNYLEDRITELEHELDNVIANFDNLKVEFEVYSGFSTFAMQYMLDFLNLKYPKDPNLKKIQKFIRKK